jgi:protein SSD1
MRPNNKRAQEEKAAEEARKSIHGKDALFKKEAPRIVWFKSTDKRVPLIAIPIEQAPHDFVDNSEAYATSLFVVKYINKFKSILHKIFIVLFFYYSCRVP